MSKKKSILRLAIPTAICAFMFVPLLSGVVSATSIREVHATASNVVWEDEASYAQINSSDLPEENPLEVLIEFTESDAATIYNSLNDEIIKVQKNNPGVVTFSNEQWASIKSDSYIQIWPEGSSKITKVSYVIAPDHTHGTGSDALGFYNWDGGAGHNSMPLEEGSYCLTSDIELQNGWTVTEGTTNLCLNGFVIKLADGSTGSVIEVPQNATLNLYDCGTTEHNGYVDSAGLWHLGEGIGTAKTITGGIITGGNTTTNGGGVNVSGTFNMYGGNIAGNTAQNGGGISNTHSFTMTGGNIVGNTATINGGGVYASSLIFVNILTGGTITDNTAQNGGGVYYQVEQCFAPGTPITMADGTRQAIETLNIGDSVRVFDHEKGEISSSKIFDVWTYPEKHSGVVKLYFSNDIDVTVVYGHSFFEHEQNKYVAVTRDNVSAFVGHEFYNVDNKRWETLEGYEFIDGEVDTYVITTEYQLNCVANGMLSNEDGFYSLLTNIFEYGDNLKIDQVKKEQDIANYGLYGYENIKHMSKHVYDILNFQYLKAAFGKGLITENEFNYLEAYYAEVDPELYCDGKEETPVESKSSLLKTPHKAPLLTSSVPAPTSGFNVGGSIKILGNNGGNLYISGGKTITVGTGTIEGGNGVVAPTEDMNIGITLADKTGKFATNGTADYLANFFSDSNDYKVCFNNNGTDDNTTDDYLELAALLTITNETPEDDKAKNNGYIELPASVVAGDEVSVTVVPNDGYKLASLKYNDGEKDYDIEDLSFVMPEGEVSVTATFEEKAAQVITFGTIYHLYNGYPIYFTEWYKGAPNNYFKRLGEGEVTIEYKVAGEDDSTYTLEAPIDAGNYVVRVSVAEDANYLAGSATKEFEIIDKVVIQKVAFNDIAQPEAGATAQTEVTGMPFGANYSGTLSWSTPIPESGKYECGVTYTATVTLSLNAVGGGLFEFADDVKVIKPSLDDTGWELSEESNSTELIFTKTFKTTAAHDMTHHDAVAPTCTEDGTVEYWTCSRETGVYYADAQGTEILSSIVDQKTGHQMVYHEAVAPTCTENGTVEHWTCSHEPGVYYANEDRTETLENIVDPMVGHDLIHHDAKAPTCTEAGWEAYDTCSRCDYSTYVEIPALGHEAPLVEGLDPTYENDGYKPAYKCATCGEYFEDQACTKLIGDETAYTAWKANAGHLDKLVKEAEEPAKDNTGLIVGLAVGGFLLLLLIIYLLGYFFLYRKGKLDERKIKVIYKILPRGNKNLKEDSQEQKENK